MPRRNKNSSAGEKDDKSEVEEASGIIMVGHSEDARLNPHYRGSNSGDNNNSKFSSKKANAATRIANNASFQVAANTSSNANPPKAVGRLCPHCSTPGHRHPECPHRPCKHCNVMDHVGKDCPEIVEDRAQRRQAGWRRYHAHLASGANRE